MPDLSALLARPRRARQEPQTMTATPTEAALERARQLMLTISRHAVCDLSDRQIEIGAQYISAELDRVRAEQRVADARRIRELEEALYNNIPWHPAIRAQDKEEE